MVSVGDIIGEPVIFDSLKKYMLTDFELPSDIPCEKFRVKDIFLHGSDIE